MCVTLIYLNMLDELSPARGWARQLGSFGHYSRLRLLSCSFFAAFRWIAAVLEKGLVTYGGGKVLVQVGSELVVP